MDNFSFNFPKFKPLPLRNWQASFPSAYAESLDIHEQMLQLLNFCNDIGLLTDQMQQNWNNLLAWVKEQGISNAVKSVLDEWVADGTFAQIINATAFPEIQKNIADLNEKYSTVIINYDQLKQLVNTNQAANDNVHTVINNHLASNDTKINDLQTALKNINSGSPKGAFASVDEMKAAYPNGTSGVLVNTTDGFWYYWDGNNWIKGAQYQASGIGKNSVNYFSLEDTLQDSIFSSSEPTSNAFNQGIVNPNFSFTDTTSWSFVMFKVKRGQVISYSTVTDNTQPILLLFDEQHNLIDTQSVYAMNNYTISSDGYLAINYYHGNSSVVSGSKANMFISGAISNDYTKMEKICDDSALTIGGYIGIGAGQISPIQPKDHYFTTDYIPVTPHNLYLLTAYLGVQNGVIGYNSDKTQYTILLSSLNTNEFLHNFLLRIPAGINYIRVSTSDEYPFRIYSTDLSLSNLANTTDINSISFSNPTADGTTGLQVKNYFPFNTDRLKIGSITENASLGLAYGNADLTTSIRVRINSVQTVCELYVGNVLKQSEAYKNDDPAGKTLQVQNTGRALILLLFDDNNYYRIGRFDYGANFDARLESYCDTWKTYIICQTASFTSKDFASFTGFESAISSAANSVSIRFLTYENGDFIQQGNNMYFLVEGTGETISDLFTQLVKIDFKTFKMQTIGAIFEVRGDGTDSGILLGDDSIKMCYDRNSESWKGISCGMEYNDYSTEKPKLYFETKQNILDGGIIICRNAKAISDSNGTPIASSGSHYAEDFDFYYDKTNNYWVVTGNSITGGFYIYHTPDLITGYTIIQTISDVPTGVRDTGNQFVNFNGTVFITTGGVSNNLGIRDFTGKYLGALKQDIPLSSLTTGPWCTLVPYQNGNKLEIYLLSFDRVNLLGNYDHGSIYIWKALSDSNWSNPVTTTLKDLPNINAVNFPSGTPINLSFYRQFSRRYFYDKNVTFGKTKLTLDTNPFVSPSDILPIIGKNNFTISKN